VKEDVFKGQSSYNEEGERCFGGEAVKPQHLLEDKESSSSENDFYDKE